MPSVTRTTTSDRAARREQIIAKLLDAVERLLESGESFTEISVERLVTEAGISRSTFYVYFEDKGTLLRALSADVITQLTGAARVWWELPPGAPREDVRRAMDGIVAAYRPHALLMGAVVDASSYDTGVRDEFGGMLDGIVGAVAEHIRHGQQQGSIRSGLDPQAVAGWLTWMTERGLYQLVRHADDKGIDRFADALTTIVWNTLYDGTR
jgi:AcrR family transcriptional regulator